MLDCYLCSARTPLWVGWNSATFQEDRPIQKIWYMSPINQSPTSDSVVAETLNIAQKVAIECEKESVAVTYELAIAKKAMQIQSTEKPKYDNVINLGGFHIEMSFFKVLGKYIEVWWIIYLARIWYLMQRLHKWFHQWEKL